MKKALTPRQREVISVIKAKESINRRELSRILNITYDCARQHLLRLQNKGVVNSRLVGRERYYSINSEGISYIERNHPTEIVRGYIQENPGIHFRKLSLSLGISRGSLGRILAELEGKKRIKSMHDGFWKRFYPKGMSIKEMPMPFTPTQRKILKVIASDPGTTYRKIALEIGRTQKDITYHVKNLLELEVIWSEMTENTNHFYTEELIEEQH